MSLWMRRVLKWEVLVAGLKGLVPAYIISAKPQGNYGVLGLDKQPRI